MKRRNSGRYVTISTVGERVQAYIPNALPPRPLPELDTVGRQTYDDALRMLGALDVLGEELPTIEPFLYACVRQEAVLSSMIEGTQSSLSDLLLFEQGALEQEESEDITEVCCYVSAMQLGMKRLADGYPISLRLMRELHAELLRSGRGTNKMPGEFRRSQNWIGGTRPGNAVYVPPPPQELMSCLGALELFINREDDHIPVLLRTAMVHVQFESIHPFLDGNGRVGRLLIPMMLCSGGILRKPLLYMSLYFKQHRQEYYRLLDGVRSSGLWVPWLEFFLDAVLDTANNAVATLRALRSRMAEHNAWAHSLGQKGKNTVKILELLQRRIIVRPLSLARQADLSPATVYKILESLRAHHIAQLRTSSARNRIYAYSPYADMLDKSIPAPNRIRPE